MADLVEKIKSFTPVDKTFKDDNGRSVNYTVFELEYEVNGEPRKMDFKTKSPDDKIVLLELADKQV